MLRRGPTASGDGRNRGLRPPRAGRGLLIALLLANALACRHARDPAIDARASTAEEAETRFLAALAGDVEALEPLLADDFLYATSEGSILDKRALLDHLRSGTTRVERIVREEKRRALHDGLVVTTGDLVVDARRHGEATRIRSRYLHVWIETPAGWQLLARQAAAPASPAGPDSHR